MHYNMDFNGDGLPDLLKSGTQRIASRLGENTCWISCSYDEFPDALQERRMHLQEIFNSQLSELITLEPGRALPVEMEMLGVSSLETTTGNPATDIFYYHTNHLGSTAFVTDGNATVTQGFLYAPFGEITTEFNASFGNGTLPKYSFNAKELDEETGMYYYEARYYAPPVFTSRDPMFEKYFWMSPYAYCANNPMKYVDPTGMDIEIELELREEKGKPAGGVVVYRAGELYNRNEDGSIGDLYTGNSPYARHVQSDLNELKEKSDEMGKIITELEQSDKVHTISMTKCTSVDIPGKPIQTKCYGNGCSSLSKEDALNGKPTGTQINYNNIETYKYATNSIDHRPTVIGLAHELGHAIHFNRGTVDFDNFENQAIEIENIARKAYSLPQRPLKK